MGILPMIEHGQDARATDLDMHGSRGRIAADVRALADFVVHQGVRAVPHMGKLRDIFGRLFGRRSEPDVGVLGDWVVVGSLTVSSGKVFVADTAWFPDNVFEIELPSGEYSVALRHMRFEGILSADERIAAVRVFRPGAELTRGEPLDELDVDGASIVVADQVLSPEEYEGRYADEKVRRREFERKRPWEPGFFTLPTTPPTLCFGCETGFGDGTYSFVELRDGDGRVGFESVFIKEGEPHPF